MKLAVAVAVMLFVTVPACTKAATTPPPANGGGASGGGTAPAPDPTPAPVALSDAELESLMGELVGFMETMTAAVEGAAGNCPAMATAYDQVAVDHVDLLERARKLDDPAIEDRLEAWMLEHGEKLGALSLRLEKATMPCLGNPAVQAAVERAGGS